MMDRPWFRLLLLTCLACAPCHGLAVSLTKASSKASSRGTGTTSLSATNDNDIQPTHHRRCVIVGGGPVGLAAALTLSNAPHYFNVTVLEKTTDEEFVGMYDPGKAYLYNVNPRGLQWVTRFPSVLEKVLERGYSPQGGFGKITRVPADPDEPIEPMKDVAIAGNVTFDPSARSVWIPRHAMVDLMMQSAAEQERARLEDEEQSQLGSLSIELGKAFVSVTPQTDESLVVKCQDGSTYEADLVVGADGISSSVREFLAGQSSPSPHQTKTWLQQQAPSFRVKKYVSPSAGLKLKSLQLPGDFAVPNTTDAPSVQIDPTSLVVLYSKNKGSRRVSLGMLPMRDKQYVRPANVITRPDHEIWSQTDGPSAKAWMEASFPRLPFEDWVNASEWERFARAKGVTYPHPQYSPGSAVPSPTDQTGVVLVGDACHAFPPDIGQGINAGLQDVQALDRALRGLDIRTGKALPNVGAASPVVHSLGRALRQYQANRGPEHCALIRLSRFGSPYQYNQSWLRDRIGKKLWFANFMVRFVLNKLTFGLIPPPAVVLMSNAKDLTYRQIMRRCDSFNLTVRALILAWLAKLCWTRWGALLL